MMRWRSTIAPSPTIATAATMTAETEASAGSGEGDDDDLIARHSLSLDDDEPDSSCSPDPHQRKEAKDPHRGALETNNNNSAERLVSAEEPFLDAQEDHSIRKHETLVDEKKLEERGTEKPPDPHVGDEGNDHAEPPKIPWKPQQVQSTCEFTHTITDYAQKRESGCKKAEYSSTTVDDFGNRWRLIIYVNGNGRASNHHLSLFLQVADADDLPFGWKKAVSYVLTLEHPGGGSLSYAKRNPDKMFKLCPKAIDWGWSQFITSDRIQQEGFVSKDALTVRASVTVKSSSVSIDEEDAELYLKCAVEEGDAAAVKLCLEQGASVNCKFKDDLYTPLHTACSSGTGKGSMKVLNLLLDEGADGNACNKWRETPLLIAANNGNLAAVDALLKHGANPSLCSEAGWSALTFAAHKGYDDIVSLLLKAGAPVGSLVAEDNSTPLHKACAGSKAGHLASVKLLLEADADVHALNKWRETPLLTAANHGQAGAVEALLLSGADPCKCTDTGWSPLSIAAYKGHDEVVRLLLEDGAPTEEADPTLSALLQAATKGLPDTVELLLSHGADHTVTTKKGDTALSILVEQNLIDTAVEMVTEYNASIPRCSRDRKKVQRARLLINHRMKQLEREGKSTGSSEDEDDDDDDDDDEEDDDEDESENDEAPVPNSAQHDENIEGLSPPIVERASKNKNGRKKMSAEEKARAAEEALLLELEQEDAKAKKEEAEANSKRAKKRKKKERERQQKMKEEHERRQKEEQEVQTRERERRAKEEQIRKEQELKLKDQRDREKKEMLEREKILEAKRKERERRERESQKKREKESQLSAPSLPANFTSKRASAPQKEKNGLAKVVVETKKTERAQAATYAGVAPIGGNRRWETKSKSPLRASLASSALKVQAVAMPRPSGTSTTISSLNSIVLNETKPLPPEFQAPRESSQRRNWAFKPVQSIQQHHSPVGDYLEHPVISLFRRQKVLEMIQKCNQVMGNTGEAVFKRAVYRWVVRAAHDQSPVLDPLIPSWKETEKLVAFFQRQFIAESRWGVARASPGFNIESLKEAGSSVALLCQNIAKEIDQLRRRVEEQLPPEWSDSELGMTAADSLLNGTDKIVSVAWANRATVNIPSSVFSSLQGRYVGPANCFLSAVFVTKIWHEAKQFIVDETLLDVQLPLSTKACLASELAANAELWSDPLSSYGNNVFWGSLEQVDYLFGGQKPFSKYSNGCDALLATHGGSVVVLLPFDNTVASRYIQRILDILETAGSSQAALSFSVFVHAESFHDLANGPSAKDLHLLDPRLRDSNSAFLRTVEVLRASQHAFNNGKEGATRICPTNSLFLLLQNDAGNSHYGSKHADILHVLRTLSTTTSPQQDSSLGLANRFVANDPTPLTPSPNYLDGLGRLSPESQFGSVVIGGTTLASSFSPVADSYARGAPSRRGRLFDLVDNGDEEPAEDVDVVTGMLNSLDVGLFQNGPSGPDIDIEAISLMGIGGTPAVAHAKNSSSAPRSLYNSIADQQKL